MFFLSFFFFSCSTINSVECCCLSYFMCHCLPHSLKNVYVRRILLASATTTTFSLLFFLCLMGKPYTTIQDHLCVKLSYQNSQYGGFLWFAELWLITDHLWYMRVQLNLLPMIQDSSLNNKVLLPDTLIPSLKNIKKCYQITVYDIKLFPVCRKCSLSDANRKQCKC